MAKKSFKINLSKVKNFHFAMQQCSALGRIRIQMVVAQWAMETQRDYDDATGYGSGLKGRRSFHEIRSDNNGNRLYVAVGHQSYIARFLEVGTKAHLIPHKNRGKNYVVSVKGIKGTRALRKVWNKRRKEIVLRIEREISNLLKGGI